MRAFTLPSIFTAAAVWLVLTGLSHAGSPNVSETEACIELRSMAECEGVILTPCKRWKRLDTQDIWGKCVRRLGGKWRRVARKRLSAAVQDRPANEGERLTAVLDAYIEAGRIVCRRRKQIDVPHLRKLPRHACALGVAISAAVLMGDPDRLTDGIPEEYEL
ncbi:MAG: hypothetical protein AAF844_02280 [Pseudomonadota bacterium]